MPRSRILHLAAWAAYATIAAVHVAAMGTSADGLTLVTQPLTGPLLLLVLVTAAPHADRTSVLVGLALLCSSIGDLLPSLVALTDARTIPAAAFLLAVALYCAALAPLWARSRDRMRYLLAIPYIAIVVGLYLAFAKGAGQLMPLLAPYAVVLAAMAFFAAGVNALTWVGGTLFMLSNALLGMLWFLPGAWTPHSDTAVMVTYFASQALLVAGFIRTFPQRRWEIGPADRGSGSMLILEG